MYTNIQEMKNKEEYILNEKINVMFNLLGQFYDDEDIKFIYLKNFNNKKEKVFYAFLEEKILIVKPIPDRVEWDLKEFKSTVIKKELIAHPNDYRNIKLTLTFENGEQVEFDNEADANDDLIEKYGKIIKMIFKMF